MASIHAITSFGVGSINGANEESMHRCDQRAYFGDCNEVPKSGTKNTCIKAHNPMQLEITRNLTEKNYPALVNLGMKHANVTAEGLSSHKVKSVDRMSNIDQYHQYLL